jgi:hypothetical protein
MEKYQTQAAVVQWPDDGRDQDSKQPATQSCLIEALVSATSPDCGGAGEPHHKFSTATQQHKSHLQLLTVHHHQFQPNALKMTSEQTYVP